MIRRKLELLAPAANAEIAIEAIKHGADAVYIGGSSHGARKSVSNSIEDIERVVDFAHQYRAKVYATVNTIVYDNEIKQVETLCHDLYHAGVDALIIQDMGILRMKIPPIALHASTQCDIRTPEKAKFLEEVGFSQLVLARELTLKEIKDITEVVSIPVETFVHGALCVCYSGRCHASFALNGRSANRGECAQICRLPYTLTDSSGKTICKDKYLLSLKDFNASHSLNDLISAGVSSFKIEGRLKEVGYVKNITSLYHERLQRIISESDGRYERSSFGEVETNFIAKADKSFNRGFTEYFLNSRKAKNITSSDTPKSKGEVIKDIKELNNGDGISFFSEKGQFTGVNINRVEGKKIIPSRKTDIPKNAVIYRTSDLQWNKKMESDTAERKLNLNIDIDSEGITASDERGVQVRLALELKGEPAKKSMDYREVFSKLGNTPFRLQQYRSEIGQDMFYRISVLTAKRRQLIELLEKANKATYQYYYRRSENKEALYPSKILDYRDNVANKLAEEFYRAHGVIKIEKAAEVKGKLAAGDTVMTTRHCILRELGMCKKEEGNPKEIRFPLYLNHSRGKYQLDFDCKACEMRLLLVD